MKAVALVTGASRGIGAAVARTLAAQGYAVAVNYVRGQNEAQALVAEIRAQDGTAEAFQADVADESAVLALFDRVTQTLGPVAVLVNNSGVTGGFTRFEDLQAATLTRVFEINVFGAFYCAREAVRRMSTRHGDQGGVIVNISSRAAKLGSPNEWIHYAASKGAIDTMTMGLSKEVATEGIRVNTVAPGLIETGLHAAAGQPDRVTRMAPGIPMARAGLPEEVAACVAWLVSPAAAYVTGAIVPVAGGR